MKNTIHNKFLDFCCSIKLLYACLGMALPPMIMSITCQIYGSEIIADILFGVFALNSYLCVLFFTYASRKKREEQVEANTLEWGEFVYAVYKVPDHIPKSHIYRYIKERKRKKGFLRNFFCDPFGLNIG